jgi:hypothetical protein
MAGGRVKQRIEEVELRSVEGQMAPVLTAFLHKVWDKHTEPDFDIYKIYVGGRPHAVIEDDPEPWDERAVQDFLDQLSLIPTPAPMIQAYGTPLNTVLAHRTWFDLTDEISEHPSIAELQKLARITKNSWIIRDLGKSFFHFRTGKSPQKRLYLSVLPQFRGQVMRHIVSHVVNQDANVTNAKVSGPLCKGLDTIVIYAKNDGGISTALSVLAEYQKGPARGFFSPQTIQLARAINKYAEDTLVGVATADEPFEYAEKLGMDGRPSFGDFWQTFLGWILDSEPRPATKLIFFKEVLRSMRDFGIDPQRPEL